MKSARVLLILLGVASSAGSVPVAADVPMGFGAPARLAQLSPEERRALREGWDSMPPEERAALRRQFEERLRQVPPEMRERHRREVLERWRNLPPEEREARRREFQDRDSQFGPRRPGHDGFGQGFEYRRFEQDWPEPPGPPARDRRR